ncbi:hypothetical protein DPMN_033234 [Dreissena polymorpha]|uniref:Uncharacterized protein n=1 Tax=Dreissena polymorpha TaxID=45954 RepID=A0A9D4M594_DREPO|nr:hypothetical protein DPMN_033234 [Dreissena polymorpha]
MITHHPGRYRKCLIVDRGTTFVATSGVTAPINHLDHLEKRPETAKYLFVEC